MSSIVAVHGLGGHRENTWKSPAPNGFHWLKPFGENPPWGANTRIMTFGYSAGRDSNLSERIFTIAENLLSDLSDSRRQGKVGHSQCTTHDRHRVLSIRLAKTEKYYLHRAFSRRPYYQSCMWFLLSVALLRNALTSKYPSIA
jgi:hypothetical protein